MHDRRSTRAHLEADRRVIVVLKPINDTVVPGDEPGRHPRVDPTLAHEQPEWSPCTGSRPRTIKGRLQVTQEVSRLRPPEMLTDMPTALYRGRSAETLNTGEYVRLGLHARGLMPGCAREDWGEHVEGQSGSSASRWNHGIGDVAKRVTGYGLRRRDMFRASKPSVPAGDTVNSNSCATLSVLAVCT